MNGIKSQDIVILLKLASIQEGLESPGGAGWRPGPSDESPYSVRSLENQLGISKSEVNSSIQRSVATGFAIRERSSGNPQPHRPNLLSFIVYGLKFIFPAAPGALSRGFPTAFAAPMLEGLLMSGGEYSYVWPAADGHVMGQSVKPLFRTVPYAVQRDPRLYEYLALVDGIRLGNPRESGLAADRLSEGLLRYDR